MYTRCSECRTLFRVTREQLNAARGRVRCGRCGNVFDALEALQEEIIFEPGGSGTPYRDSPDEPPAVRDTECRSYESDAPDEPPAIEDSTGGSGTPYRDRLVPPRRRRWPWALAAAVLLAALAAQLAHHNRATLAAHSELGPYISMAYERLGLPLEARVRYDLRAFELLHHELVSHPRDAGALHLSGVLSNDADFAQPWPVLELKLEDRFGDIVAARRLQPSEYLRNPPDGDEPMPARARRAIEIEFVDPGHDAVGFSIEFCVMLRGELECAVPPGASR